MSHPTPGLYPHDHVGTDRTRGSKVLTDLLRPCPAPSRRTNHGRFPSSGGTLCGKVHRGKVRVESDSLRVYPVVTSVVSPGDRLRRVVHLPPIPDSMPADVRRGPSLGVSTGPEESHRPPAMSRISPPSELITLFLGLLVGPLIKGAGPQQVAHSLKNKHFVHPLPVCPSRFIYKRLTRTVGSGPFQNFDK